MKGENCTLEGVSSSTSDDTVASTRENTSPSLVWSSKVGVTACTSTGATWRR